MSWYKFRKFYIIRGEIPIYQGQNGGIFPLERGQILLFNLFNVNCMYLFCFLENDHKHYFELFSLKRTKMEEKKQPRLVLSIPISQKKQ